MKGKKILIVEDDKFFAELIAKKFTDADVTHSASGEEAITHLVSNVPDLVVLDLLLPGIDGFGVLKKIREDAKLKNTKVMVLSNFGSPEQIKQGQELGVNSYLIKATVTPDEILKEATELLK